MKIKVRVKELRPTIDFGNREVEMEMEHEFNGSDAAKRSSIREAMHSECRDAVQKNLDEWQQAHRVEAPTAPQKPTKTYEQEDPFEDTGREPGSDDEAPLKERPQTQAAQPGQGDDGSIVVDIKYVNTTKYQSDEPLVDCNGKLYCKCKSACGKNFSVFTHNKSVWPPKVGMSVRIIKSDDGKFWNIAESKQSGGG